MHRKDLNGVGDYGDALSPVLHASGVRMIMSLATAFNMHINHAGIISSQPFVQGEFFPGDGSNRNVQLSAACPTWI